MGQYCLLNLWMSVEKTYIAFAVRLRNHNVDQWYVSIYDVINDIVAIPHVIIIRQWCENWWAGLLCLIDTPSDMSNFDWNWAWMLLICHILTTCISRSVIFLNIRDTVYQGNFRRIGIVHGLMRGRQVRKMLGRWSQVGERGWRGQMEGEEGGGEGEKSDE